MFCPCDYNSTSAIQPHFFFAFELYKHFSLVCSYKNGSFAREKVRDSCASGQWEEFDRLLASTQPGNDGNIGNMYTKICRVMHLIISTSY